MILIMPTRLLIPSMHLTHVRLISASALLPTLFPLPLPLWFGKPSPSHIHACWISTHLPRPSLDALSSIRTLLFFTHSSLWWFPAAYRVKFSTTYLVPVLVSFQTTCSSAATLMPEPLHMLFQTPSLNHTLNQLLLILQGPAHIALLWRLLWAPLLIPLR